MIIELVKNARIIVFNPRIQEDVRLANNMEKLLSFMVTFGTACGYVFSGMYGGITYIGYFKAFMLIVQLTFAGLMVLYLDELLEKGYGIGSGTSLFIACNMCENLFWHAFSPVTMKTDNGIEFEGAIIALFHFLLTKENKLNAIYLAFYRQNVANLHNIFTTILIFMLVIFLMHFQVNLKLIQSGRSGATSTLPIKLFYLSNTPIMIQTTIISQLHIMSSILYSKFKNYSWVRFLAVWQIDPMTGRDKLIGGLTFYLTPPRGVRGVMDDPMHFIIYTLIIVITCALFARAWLDISGRSPLDILRQLNDAKMFVAGSDKKDRAMITILKRNINTAATLGGVFIGLFSIFSDLVGSIGSGTGIMLTVNIIYNYYSKIKDDLKEFNLKDIVMT
jgi:protein transport protein SEC61 subunit alpha